jgi:hypothetical protein
VGFGVNEGLKGYPSFQSGCGLGLFPTRGHEAVDALKGASRTVSPSISIGRYETGRYEKSKWDVELLRWDPKEDPWIGYAYRVVHEDRTVSPFYSDSDYERAGGGMRNARDAVRQCGTSQSMGPLACRLSQHPHPQPAVALRFRHRSDRSLLFMRLDRDRSTLATHPNLVRSPIAPQRRPTPLVVTTNNPQNLLVNMPSPQSSLAPLPMARTRTARNSLGTTYPLNPVQISSQPPPRMMMSPTARLPEREGEQTVDGPLRLRGGCIPCPVRLFLTYHAPRTHSPCRWGWMSARYFVPHAPLPPCQFSRMRADQ